MMFRALNHLIESFRRRASRGGPRRYSRDPVEYRLDRRPSQPVLRRLADLEIAGVCQPDVRVDPHEAPRGRRV